MVFGRFFEYFVLNATEGGATWRSNQRISIFGWHVAKYTESKLFDEFVYGAVSTLAILEFGPQLGACVTFLIMAPISALFCTIYLHLYDRVKTDLFGFEMIKGIRDDTAITGWWRHLLHRIIQWGDIPAFIVLNCFWPNGDPFMATVYLRKGSEQYNGLSRRDWDIFWASVLVSNAWWSFRWAVIVVFFKELICATARSYFLLCKIFINPHRVFIGIFLHLGTLPHFYFPAK